MSTVIDQPRNDVPIVADATLLAVPNMNDDNARAEYLQKIRALRNPPKEAEPAAPQPQAEVVDVQPDDVPSTDYVEPPEDAIVDSQTQDTQSNRVRLSPDDLRDYEIPVTDENGNVTYLSYEEFDKTVGLYSKQNKRARELADREREVDALKNQLLSEQGNVIQQTSAQELAMAQRYQWIQNSLAFAHKHGVDVVKFEDGTTKKVTQLITEKTALETQYNNLSQRKQQAQLKIQQAQMDFVAQQDQILDQRAPNIKKARNDISKYLERNGFTAEEAAALAFSKAELLMVIDKAMKYENAGRSQPKEKKVASNTRVLKQPSRLAGRGTPVNSPSTSRISELQGLGTKATPDQLRELRRLQLQNR
jgi:hypothetical protein